MSGQPTPPIIVEPFANSAPDCDPSSPIPGGRTNPFPAPSQIGTTPGAASLTDGLPPLTMTSLAAGGVFPYGVDFNGILYLLSSHDAFVAAGQLYQYDVDLSTAMGGYAEGAILQQAADPLAQWINLVPGNTSDPDAASPLGSTGWISSKPLNLAVSLTGVINNYALPGASDYLLDVTATGAVTFNGFVAQRDGQKLTVRKVDASGNGVTLASLAGASAAANQIQIITGGIGMPLQYMSTTIQWNATVNKWVQV